MRQIFAHLHIPKCGGTTVADVLSRNFGAGLSTTNSILNDYQYNAAQIARIIDSHPQLKCITGHKLSLDLPFDRKDLDIHAFTWIRDPVDRFVSHYFYHRSHTNLVPEAKTMNLLEYTEWALKYKNQKMYINGQTKFLSGGSMKTIRSMVKDEKLLIFPLSKLHESFYTLAQRYPDAFTRAMKKNKNISRKDQAVPSGFRELVLPYVEEDMCLLELSKQTKLEDEMPHRQNHLLGKEHIAEVRIIAFQSANFLHRVARFIEKQC